MTGRHSFESLRKGMSATSLARSERKAAQLRHEMNLAELRRAVSFSQEEIASTLGINQASVAKIEKRTDMFISTLRRFIRAMGGDLEIAAVFGKERVLIEQFHSIVPRPVYRDNIAQFTNAFSHISSHRGVSEVAMVTSANSPKAAFVGSRAPIGLENLYRQSHASEPMHAEA